MKFIDVGARFLAQHTWLDKFGAHGSIFTNHVCTTRTCSVTPMVGHLGQADFHRALLKAAIEQALLLTAMQTNIDTRMEQSEPVSKGPFCPVVATVTVP